MTKTEKKIADLEKRVKELEARPAIVVYPVQQYPAQPSWPYYPPHWPIITCTSVTSGPG